ncbi:MAG: creatininase family protein [Bacilli bacterium]|nr:creatininase family protein [Bacilli bacterium]
MHLNKMFPKEIKECIEANTPLVIPGGTVEYHGPHCSYGCDSLVVEGLIEKLALSNNIIIAPSISYSPSSYAVGDKSTGTVHVKEKAFEDYVYYIFKSFLYSGFKNIYVVIHHQFEQESEMPMTLCYRLAAKRATMEYLEETLGQGWWGSESYANYYEQLEGNNNPFNWIKVIPTMSSDVQNKTGYDHAGKYESSILMSLYPECVTKERIDDIDHWFTKSAKEANKELGDEMVSLSLDYLSQTIK